MMLMVVKKKKTGPIIYDNCQNILITMGRCGDKPIAGNDLPGKNNNVSAMRPICI